MNKEELLNVATQELEAEISNLKKDKVKDLLREIKMANRLVSKLQSQLEEVLESEDEVFELE